ncbi:MAG TPA: hypothetical protein EYH35_01480, partial [Thiotrichaceae bacterium]|nr:hypothetical protein [Thiotrichaceae bacterium]
MNLFRVLSSLMLLMIVLSIIAILLFSPLGTTTVSRLINKSNAGVELSGAKGSLLTGLKFEDIHWHDDKTDVVLKHTTFKPNKFAYFKNQLSASELTTEALIITIQKSNSNGNKKVEIPNIPIPFNGQIDQLKINKLIIQDTEGHIRFQAQDLVAHNLTLLDQTIQTTQLQGLLDIHHQPMEVNLSPFQLQLDQPHHMSGKGKINYKHPLAGQFQANANISGTLTNYTLDTHLIWKEFATGKNNINLKLEGDYDHIVIQSMQLHNENGDIRLKGKVSWLPTLKIDTLIEGENIQAQKFNPQLPSQVNLKTKLHAEYNYDDSSWEVHNQFERLVGQLNQHKITGKGTIELKDHILRADKFQLTSNDNILKVDGRITEPFQLSWDINAQHIKQLLPNMTGSIKGKGTLKGT